jgi:hypothetical protein
MAFEEVRKISLDYTVTGLETICPLGAKPFRFLYISGSNTTRDQTKKPLFMADYSLMRVSEDLSFSHPHSAVQLTIIMILIKLPS